MRLDREIFSLVISANKTDAGRTGKGVETTLNDGQLSRGCQGTNEIHTPVCQRISSDIREEHVLWVTCMVCYPDPVEKCTYCNDLRSHRAHRLSHQRILATCSLWRYRGQHSSLTQIHRQCHPLQRVHLLHALERVKQDVFD